MAAKHLAMANQTPMRPSNHGDLGKTPRAQSTQLKAALRAVVLLVAIALLVSNTDLSRFLAQLNRGMFVAALLAQPFVAASLVLLGWRLALLARRPAAPLVPCVKAAALTIGLNVALPARLSELIKPVFLRDHADLPLTSGFAAVFLERLGDVVILGLLALTTIGLHLGGSNPWLLVAATGVAVITLALLPRLEAFLSSIVNRIPWRSLRRFIQQFLAHTSARVRQGDLARAYFVGLGAWALSVCAAATFLLMAGSRPIGPTGILMVFVATTIGAALPVLPAGFGAYEGAAAVALMNFGYSLEEGLAIGLGMHMSQLATPVAAALIVLALDRIGFKALADELREIGAVASNNSKGAAVRVKESSSPHEGAGRERPGCIDRPRLGRESSD